MVNSLALSLLEFLYASMPMPDSVDYSREFWTENIECTLRAREEMPWGAQIPEREFRHFVLPVRVNNEDLDRSRMVLYDALKPRLEGLTMTEAALEVNHWCHEHVTYQPSDARTSAPLATIRTAYGRCGEESTLLVAALRSVGIPARQVYTPRWAHTDDNHAWVEAWVDGEWHFMGACEPEAVLDLGWFNAPASRAMLMHTKAFGAYDGPEEVMQRTPCFTEIDVTANYAPVARRYVQVCDAEGKPVADAQVEFKIYNYAEFYTVATHHTDGQGLTSMQAGRGDLLAWASKDGCYGFDRCTFGLADTLRICLDHHSGESYSIDVDIVPPPERNTVPAMTEAQRQENARRLVYEDSIRNAYVATFPTAYEGPLSSDRVTPLVKASRGNYATLLDFLAQSEIIQRPDFALNLLESLSAKDLRDVTPEVLADHARQGLLLPSLIGEACPDSVFFPYILCPRVDNERLTPFRSQLLEAMGATSTTEIDKLRAAKANQGIAALIDWVADSILIDDAHNPQRLCMSPLGVYRHRVTDSHSRDIFFVALARTFGFPSRIDPVTGKVQYYQNNCWQDVSFLSTKASERAVVATQSKASELGLSYQPTSYLANPKYYTHFTLSSLTHGSPTLLNYGEEDTWQSLFGATTQQLDAGDYLLTTGTRMADGSVLAHLEVAPLAPENTLTLPLTLRHADTGLQVIGNFNSENLYLDLKDGRKSLLSTTGRGYYVLGLIASGQEPSNHALRDIARCREQIEAWGGHLVLLFSDEADAARFQQADFPPMPQHTHFGTDIDGSITSQLCSEMHVSATSLPIFIIADTFNRIVFISEGYTIGLGDQLVSNLTKLAESK